jgi:hypothetical protein
MSCGEEFVTIGASPLNVLIALTAQTGFLASLMSRSSWLYRRARPCVVLLVRINDRLPHDRGRIIDLSRAVARELDIIGTRRVSVVGLFAGGLAAAFGQTGLSLLIAIMLGRRRLVALKGSDAGKLSFRPF